MTQILAIVLSRLGDLVQSFPAFSDLNRWAGGSGISVLVQKNLAEVARMHPAVKNVIPFDGDALMPILKREGIWSKETLSYLSDIFSEIESLRPERVVNLTHTAFSARLTGLISGAEVRGRTYYQSLGPAFCGEWTRYFFTLLTSRNCNTFNLVDIHREISSGITGCSQHPQITDAAHRFAVEQVRGVRGQNIIVLGIGAHHPLRRWHLDRWLYTARILRERCDAGFVLVGSSAEWQMADKIRVDFNGHCTNLCGQTNPEQLAAVLDQCDLFIGHDSGPLHLAAALGTRCLGIFLAMASAWETAPYLDGAVAIEPDLACHPCNERGNCSIPICQHKITPEVIADAAIRLLYGDQPGGYPGCIARVARWDEDGYMTLAGDGKTSDNLRLAWRRLLPVMLNMDDPNWDYVNSTSHKRAVLPVMQHSIGELKDTIRQVMEVSSYQHEHLVMEDHSESEKLFDLEIPGLIARFPEYRPLFDLYRLDKLPGEPPRRQVKTRDYILAQDKLMRRIGIIQEFCSDAEKLYFPVSPLLRVQDSASLSPVI